jgi:DNA-binding NarL/FixJ family response regulator
MPVKILVVDDHRLVRDGLRLRLQQENDFIVVGEAGSGREACERTAETAPDLVIMDVNLPQESGIAAIARIHAISPKTRVLAITGSAGASTAHDAILAGANGFIRKEDASDELVRAIRVIMDGKVYLNADAATALTHVLLNKSDSGIGREPALTEREMDVLVRIAEGLSYKEIASDLHLSVKTVETYRARLAEKLGVTSKVEMARYAVRKGLVAP